MPRIFMNPATNDQPLQFNMNKNKPPMALPLDEVHHQERALPGNPAEM